MPRAALQRTEHDGNPPPQYPIESVDNALRILLLFEERSQIRLTDASEYLNVASSTAHRLLAMLLYRGFVRQNPATRAYEPGRALTAISRGVMSRLDSRAAVRPWLERLHREFSETVHLGQLDGDGVTFIDSIEGTRAVRVGTRVGRVLPAHATSTGKAMLSLLDDDALDAVYPAERLPAVTKKSITKRSALKRELALIRERGYATSDEESEDGVTSVAVALTSINGSILALNVSVPKHRMEPKLQKQIVARLLTARDELTKMPI